MKKETESEEAVLKDSHFKAFFIYLTTKIKKDTKKILFKFLTNSLFHSVKYKNHSVGYIFHSAGYKSRTVKQRIYKEIAKNKQDHKYLSKEAILIFINCI